MLYRDGIYYYVRRVPHDLTSHYDVKRLCFSLKTKSASAAIRASKSINQRLEDYWLNLRLQNMDIPAIKVFKSSDSAVDDGLLLSQACELYLRLKSVCFLLSGQSSTLPYQSKRWSVAIHLQTPSSPMITMCNHASQCPFKTSGRCNLCAKR